MKLSPTVPGARFARRIERVTRRAWPYRNRLLLVVDEAGWVVDEVGRGLRQHLPAGMRARLVGSDWRASRHCTIHFIDRSWAWADGVLDAVHPSNRLLGLWWHGRLDSPEPELRAGLKRLRRLHGRFARIQVTCSSARETLLALGVPLEKIVQLPEGVDLRRFRPATSRADKGRVRKNLGISDEAIVIGSFQKDGTGWANGSTPKLIKGPDVLADAIIAIPRSIPVHVLLPGPARGYISQRLAAAGVPFTAPGFVHRSEMPHLYHALDIYVSPSRDEGGPAGVLESMASGIPVVSTQTGMAPDLIESGENGLLIRPGDATALAAALATLAEAEGVRLAIARRAVETIAGYDWSVLAERYVTELYAS